jgi:hypothetical protein
VKKKQSVRGRSEHTPEATSGAEIAPPVSRGGSRPWERWMAVGAAVAALGFLLWARIIITAQVPRVAVAEDPAEAPGAAGDSVDVPDEGAPP